MESGSLLADALKGGNSLQNVLQVDVFLFNDSEKSESSSLRFVALAQLGIELNIYLHKIDYPWLMGPAPVFGVHVTNHIPHLRSQVHYGVSVADEWKFIQAMMQYTAANDKNIVVECWDVDDGQVLLIESALELPAWVDAIGPEACRHRCWIRHGKILLIKPDANAVTEPTTAHALSLQQALTLLQQRTSPLVVSYPNVDAVLQQSFSQKLVPPKKQRHCAAVVVPRSVATLMKYRPDLVALACNAFVEQAAAAHHSTTKHNNKQQQQSPLLAGTCHDWIWTTHEFGRTQYAMLRTFLAAPLWTSDDAIPAPYASMVQVKRLRQQHSMSAPHFKRALPLGVRIVAGLEYLLRTPAPVPPPSALTKLALRERRVLHYWNRIVTECCTSNTATASSSLSSQWLMDAWHAGPNHATIDLEPIANCPVFAEEAATATTFAWTHQDESIVSQIRAELLRKQQVVDGTMPRADMVDSEDWMTMPDHHELNQAVSPKSMNVTTTTPTSDGHVLDNMLSGVDTFMEGKSGVDGVDNARQRKLPTINPTVFLQLLHATLKAKTAEEIEFPIAPDYYFAEEDYEMDEDENDLADGEMVEFMDAMDQEIKGSDTASRQLDSNDLNDGEVTQSMHVLSNLLKSLDAGSGRSGPVQNMLSEIGIQAPENADDIEDYE
jgi:hypothetical protein